MVDELKFPSGLKLLSDWQSGDQSAKARLKDIFDAAIVGDLDANFAIPAPSNAVNIGGSVNLMTLTIMHDLYGIESAEFYKNDAERYVRTTLLSRRLLGMNTLYQLAGLCLHLQSPWSGNDVSRQISPRG